MIGPVNLAEVEVDVAFGRMLIVAVQVFAEKGVDVLRQFSHLGKSGGDTAEHERGTEESLHTVSS